LHVAIQFDVTIEILPGASRGRISKALTVGHFLQQSGGHGKCHVLAAHLA
jgi:hypothetical protein